MVLPALQEEEEEEVNDNNEGRPRLQLNVDVAIEVIAVLLPSIMTSDDRDRLTQATLSSTLRCIRTRTHPSEQPLVSKVAVRLLLTLLNSSRKLESSSTLLRFTLDELFAWHRSGDDATATATATATAALLTERTLLCLTVLSDHLFPPGDVIGRGRGPSPSISISTSTGPPSPAPDARLWRIVQDGLTHGDNVCRKRALYLLRRCVAFSDQEQEEGAEECPTSSSDEGTLQVV